ADSVATIPWAVFCITAHTAVPSVWYASPPDSGWSVDNIAPQVPTAFSVAYGPSTNALTWDACPDRDFAYFRVYRSASTGFEPAPENLAHLTTDIGWTDADTGGLVWHYKLTAVDDAENESAPASAQGAVGIDEPSLPRAVALHPVAPNPFNPATAIAFDLVQAVRVRLEIFDAAGRRVRVLLDETRAAGAHRARWDGTGDDGRAAASGVYFCRMDAGAFQGTRRMTLVR
ncbi:MAG: FlgD immunoglobulin-like domain containing protein, partial [bacterium]|nr:FlgD immunoglobulin-like domain containing protein [bacterium]